MTRMLLLAYCRLVRGGRACARVHARPNKMASNSGQVSENNSAKVIPAEEKAKAKKHRGIPEALFLVPRRSFFCVITW